MFARVGRHVRQQYAGFLALFIALGGVSYAAVTLPANTVGSKQIKRGAVKNADLGKSAVTGAKVKNGSLRSADFKAGDLPTGPTGPQGPPGVAGAKGEPGANGAPGQNGTTVFPSSIPSGTTMTGVAGQRWQCAASCVIVESFVVPAPTAPTAANFAPDGNAATTDDDAACAGTANAPTAPAGKVCLYYTFGVNLSAANGEPVNVGDGRGGFRINLTPTTAGADTEIRVVWAYTAP